MRASAVYLEGRRRGAETKVETYPEPEKSFELFLALENIFRVISKIKKFTL